MRPRTWLLLLLAVLALGWYIAEPSATSNAPLVRGLPSGSPNYVALGLLTVVLVVMVWPWLSLARNREDEK